MDYDGISDLDALLSDSSATEFLAKLLDIPVDQTESNFGEWITKSSGDWGSDYQPMLVNLQRLVEEYTGYDAAMGAIKKVQDAERAKRPSKVEVAVEPPPKPAAKPKDPAAAAKALNAQLSVELIEKLQREHPEVLPQLTPEELRTFAIDAVVKVIG